MPVYMPLPKDHLHNDAGSQETHAPFQIYQITITYKKQHRNKRIAQPGPDLKEALY